MTDAPICPYHLVEMEKGSILTEVHKGRYGA